MQDTKPRRSKKILLFLLLAVLIAAWPMLWFAASHFGNRGLDEWMAREQAVGRTWSCGSRTTGGLPLDFRLSCNKLSLQSAQGAAPLALNADSLVVTYSPLRPLSVVAALNGPLQLKSGANQQTLNAEWDRLTVTLSRGLSSPVSAVLSGRKLKVVTTQPDGRVQNFTTEILDLNLSPARKDSSETLAGNLLIEGFASPALSIALGNTEPAAVKSTFDLTAFEHLKRGNMPARLDAWRQAGGALQIRDLNLTKGRLALEATGNLQIDALRRPAGNLNTRTAGLSSLLEKLGVPGMGGSRGGVLGGLLRRNNPAPESEEPAGRFVPLPLTLRDGFVWLGPIRTPVALQPLIPASNAR